MTAQEISKMDKISGLSQSDIASMDAVVSGGSKPQDGLPQIPEPLGKRIIRTAAGLAKPVMGAVGGIAGTVGGTALLPGAGTVGGAAFGTGAGVGAGEAVEKSLLNLIGEQPAMTQKEKIASAMSGPVAGLETYVTGRALEGIGKILNPFKTVGEYRAAKIAEASGKTISGDALLKSFEGSEKIISPTMKPAWERFMVGAKQMYEGKTLTIDEAVKLNQTANQAFTAAGKTGKGATALFNRVLGDSLKQQLEINAPAVAKANKAFQNLYNAKNLAGKLALPTSIAGAAGWGINKLKQGMGD